MSQSKSCNKINLAIIAGLALFAMFFGTGNLIAPIITGIDAKSQYKMATMGLLTASILVPFLGLFSVIYCSEKENDFFAELGPKISFILSLVILLLIGPFGAGSRCMLAGSKSLNALFADYSVISISIAFTICAYILLKFRENIVEIIGKLFTPLIILGLAVLLIIGILASASFIPTSMGNAVAFRLGLEHGYKTMDFLAAFFFAAIIITYLKNNLGKDTSKKELSKVSLYACLIGIGLLALTYVGFITIGAKFATDLNKAAPEQMLINLANAFLGPIAVPVVAVVIFLACLTTICILTELFASFLHERICVNRISKDQAIFVTLIATFGTSVVNFTQLADWVASVLYLFYPALIVFVLLKIFQTFYKYSRNVPLFAFWITAGVYSSVKYFYFSWQFCILQEAFI